MKRHTEIYSIFGQIDEVIASSMVDEGKLLKIDRHMIPDTARFDDDGREAVFAVVVPDKYAAEYMSRVAALRA